MKKKILIAEDEPHIARLIAFKLEKGGFDAVIAENGQITLDRLGDSGPFALVILDMMMPVLDGIQTLTEIRKKPELSKLPVLFLTARGLKKDEDQAQWLDIQAYVKKPFDPDELLKQVQALIQDPEWDALVQDFKVSMGERIRQIDSILEKPIESLESLLWIAHKIAGIAKNYGFEPLGNLAYEIENGLDERRPRWAEAEVLEWGKLQAQRLKERLEQDRK